MAEIYTTLLFDHTILTGNKYKAVSTDADKQTLITALLLESQIANLEPLVGLDLIKDIVDDPTDAENVKAKAAIEPFMAYITYERYVRDGNASDTGFGLKKKQNPWSNDVGEKEIIRRANQAASMAEVYKKKMLAVLKDLTLPLYDDFVNKNCPPTGVQTNFWDVSRGGSGAVANPAPVTQISGHKKVIRIEKTAFTGSSIVDSQLTNKELIFLSREGFGELTSSDYTFTSSTGTIALTDASDNENFIILAQ